MHDDFCYSQHARFLARDVFFFGLCLGLFFFFLDWITDSKTIMTDDDIYTGHLCPAIVKMGLRNS